MAWTMTRIPSAATAAEIMIESTLVTWLVAGKRKPVRFDAIHTMPTGATNLGMRSANVAWRNVQNVTSRTGKIMRFASRNPSVSQRPEFP
ncbi:MAG: hypothetical protein IPF53_08215 [Blastocatellia bacterium]|nr:hypothetical protein [Blastocatellia bacterium]